MARIDETNLQILHLLQKNGRMTMTELASAVGRSESTVRERVTSLELAGLLKGYQAQVDWAQAGLPALAIVRGSCEPARADELAKLFFAIPNVTRAHIVTGPKPVFAIVRVRDTDHLQRLLKERIPAGLLKDLEVEVVLETLVERRPVTAVHADVPVVEARAAPNAAEARRWQASS